MEKVICKFRQTEQPKDCLYWQNQSPEVRIAALEQIRREYHQHKYNSAHPRLQRIYRIIK
ncbi:hypothetical protein NIES970_20670 [[Synechococcus] sp. NIES-970]|nr:hypothetical protein NIES970_20670 [[Synechococcus] sp. NIES-970]